MRKLIWLFAAAFVCLMQAPTAKAAISVTANACGKSSGSAGMTTTLIVSCSSNVTQGNELVILWQGGAVGASAVCTDTMGNVWTSVSATPSQSVGYCYGPITAATGADTVTLTTTNTIFIVIFSLELAGQAGTPFDVGGTASAPGAGASWTLPSVVTTVANDIVIGFGGNNNVNNTFTAGAGYTIPTGTCGFGATGVCGQASGGGQSAFIEYQIVTTATTYTPTVSISNVQSGNTNTISFKPNTTVGGSTIR